ncbi:helix-turn-helix domain-containing protein [Nannocystis sp. SCPEA4]|uniref:helix-turn-helix domain-containing protein n=1 Tax=Nannocystis sp. SCPEA4 TaxID=2996787 RepID=UPI00226E5BC4|nr:helix-turn-helix domain-containing protein [Nannocystis sp. SCPEA4]MCY1062156.1 hypothetical protein [Nannocystis sp. SCPEA4]
MAKLPARLRLPTLNLKELEAIAIRLALERNFWGIAEAAEDLGISRWALMRRMRALQIRSPRSTRTPSDGDDREP